MQIGTDSSGPAVLTSSQDASIPAWVRHTVIDRRWPLPLVVAFVVVGPVLMPGMVLNLDLILVPRLDIPSGFWGLGPELPRRLPLWVPISMVSEILPATVVGKALLVGQIVLAWTGMARRFRSAGPIGCHIVGALYALSPFMTTRAVVGHFSITLAFAVLPWVLPVLAHPGRRLGTTFLAASALAISGHFGGSLAVLLVLVAIAVGDRHRWAAAIAVTAIAQAVWLVPGVAVWLTTTTEPSSSADFATAVDGLDGFARLGAGGGYWNTYYQVGDGGWLAAGAGLVLLALALIGSRQLPGDSRRILEVAAAIGFFMAVASVLPVVATVFDAVSANPTMAVWREGHRLLGLSLLWLAPAAVFGSRRLAGSLRSVGWPRASSAMTVLPLALATMLTMPALWAFGGRLESTPVPDGWNEVREIVRRNEGTTLALPWRQYFDLQVGDAAVARVLHPLPLFLGGDVISSSNNELGDGARERGDPREPVVDDLIAKLEQGADISTALAGVGVRWVVLLPTVESERYSALERDPDLSRVYSDADIEVFEVEEWPGPALDDEGVEASVDQLVPGFVRMDRDATVWNAPGGIGWRRDWQPTATSSTGTVALEPGGRLVWSVTTLPAVLAQMAWAAAVIALLHRRRSLPPTGRDR
jgi:hypothetical protein